MRMNDIFQNNTLSLYNSLAPAKHKYLIKTINASEQNISVQSNILK